MLQIIDNVRQEITKLIPASLVSDISCFVFYDYYPRSKERFDIAICTKKGNLLEYYQRELTFSIKLDTENPPKDLRIMRNLDSNIFYLAATSEEVFIISKKDATVHRKLTNVDKYSMNDPTCSGQALLKVVRKDDAVPIVFDKSFNELGEKAIVFSDSNEEREGVVVENQLKQKLIEAQYSVKCNERTLKEYAKLRQRAALAVYNRIDSKSKDSLFKSDSVNMPAVRIKMHTSFIKVCNQRVVIVKHIVNENKESINNMAVLINANSSTSLNCLTKVYEKMNTTPPFWREKPSQNIPSNSEAFVVCIINLDDLIQNDRSEMEINGVVSYYLDGEDYLIPFDNEVLITDCLGDELNNLSSNNDTTAIILSLIATTDKVDLLVRNIRTDNIDPEESFFKAFYEFLNKEFEAIGGDKMLVYKKSPYMILYGCMVVFNDCLSSDVLDISVYARSQPQVMSLIRLIYDLFPYKLIITTPNYKITAKTPELSHYNETIDKKSLNYKEYASSLLKRSNLILEHFDNSMIKMSESKSPDTLNRIGTTIDLFAMGVDKFKEFRNNLLEEALKGLEVLNNGDCGGEDVMVID